MNESETIAVDSTGEEITRLHEHLTIENVIRMGELLTEKKSQLPHGEWHHWQSINLKFGRYTAAHYMKIFVHRDECNGLTHLAQVFRAIDFPRKKSGERRRGERMVERLGFRIAKDGALLAPGITEERRANDIAELNKLRAVTDALHAQVDREIRLKLNPIPKRKPKGDPKMQQSTGTRYLYCKRKITDLIKTYFFQSEYEVVCALILMDLTNKTNKRNKTNGA